MLRPNFSPDAIRFLKKRDSKQFVQLLRAIIMLCDDPRPSDSIAMAGGRNFRKDAGEIRIIYFFDKEVIYFAVIGKRNDASAYREFDRKSKR